MRCVLSLALPRAAPPHFETFFKAVITGSFSAKKTDAEHRRFGLCSLPSQAEALVAVSGLVRRKVLQLPLGQLRVGVRGLMFIR